MLESKDEHFFIFATLASVTLLHPLSNLFLHARPVRMLFDPFIGGLDARMIFYDGVVVLTKELMP